MFLIKILIYQLIYRLKFRTFLEHFFKNDLSRFSFAHSNFYYARKISSSVYSKNSRFTKNDLSHF